MLQRVGRAGHVGVGERPQHVDDGVGLADPGQELVAQPLALASALDQAADVDELHGGRHHVLRSRSSRPGPRGGGPAPWPRRRWGRSWRRRRARPAPSRPRARCTARTSPRWEDRRTRSAPSRCAGYGLAARTLGPHGAEQRSRADERRGGLRRGSPTCSTGSWRRPTGCGPSSRAAEVVAELDDDELAARVERATRSPSSRTSATRPRPSSARPTRARRPPTWPSWTPPRSTPATGADLRAALKGDCHAHSTWSDGGAPIRAHGRGGHGPRPRVPGDDRPLPPPHDRPRPQPRAAARPAGRDRRAERRAGARSASSPGSRSTSSRTARLDQAEDLLERLDVVVASVHSKFRMPEQQMTERLVMAVASPHVDILGHCTNRKVVGKGRPRLGLRRRHRLRRLRPLRHRGRDQLPPRAPGPARRAAGRRPRVGLQGGHRHRRPRPGPAGVAGLRLREGRPPRHRAPTTSSTRCRPTISWPGPGPRPSRRRGHSAAARSRLLPRAPAGGTARRRMATARPLIVAPAAVS